jgi:hypothetical protein
MKSLQGSNSLALRAAPILFELSRISTPSLKNKCILFAREMIPHFLDFLIQHHRINTYFEPRSSIWS